ncbi:MAG: hypothetical protein KDJ47_08850 [Hyphomicrobiaceae bacterium]|nr:hypothetical protein [Hyphomicrobiaceae bacterium]
MRKIGCRIAGWPRRTIVARHGIAHHGAIRWVMVTFLAIFLTATTLVPRVSAVEIDFTAKPVLRKVLALYDGAAEPTPTDTRIHRFAEFVLNHLGYVINYQDINKPLPDASELSSYRGLLTWLLEPVANPRQLGEWLEQATSAPGLRYVVLGDILPEDTARHADLAANLYRRLGLNFSGDHIETSFTAKVAESDDGMIGFERPLDKVLPDFPMLEVDAGLASQMKVHLAFAVALRGKQDISAVVVTGPNGGFAAEGFTIYYEPTADRVAWILNPFAFFALALGSERFPIPDVTTVSGRRIYFSHIDGDGWNNQTEIAPYKADGLLSSEVILQETIAPYPDLPVSVALIGCDVKPEFGATPKSGAVARSLFALPQVEIASHTHTHPFNWQFYENYNRKAEMDLVDASARPAQSWRESLSEKVHLMAGKPAPVTRSSKYIAGSDDLPRSFLKNPFELGTEVAGAIKETEAFAPADKKVKVYQWSGDTQPFEAAVRATRAAGVRNINGGDSRFDREYPSVAYVPPISRTVGKERQIYAANSNENTYTNDWTGPYYGFFMLGETLKNTESPRRLKPFNLYYHMYSGEKPAALAAVRHFLEEARSSRVIPLATSDYAALADDFFGVVIEQVAPNAWAVRNRGTLQTVRFDNAEDIGVDMNASVGVLGANRTNDALYVALDGKVERAVIQLGLRDAAQAQQSAADSRPTLRDSRWRLSGLKGDDCQFSYEAQGFGEGDMSFQTAPGRRFDVSVNRGQENLAQVTARAGTDGVMQLALPAAAITPVQVEFACHD